MRKNKLPTDSGTIIALSKLQKLDPHNHYVFQMMGYIRYIRGGVEIVQALHDMMSAISAGTTNILTFEIA